MFKVIRRPDFRQETKTRLEILLLASEDELLRASLYASFHLLSLLATFPRVATDTTLLWTTSCMQSTYSTSPGRRHQQASAYGPGDSGHAGSSSSTSSSAELYRSLVFGGSVPLCICLLPEELPAGSDRSIDSVYVGEWSLWPATFTLNWLTVSFTTSNDAPRTATGILLLLSAIPTHGPAI